MALAIVLMRTDGGVGQGSNSQVGGKESDFAHTSKSVMRENTKSKMASVFWPKRLEEWQCHLLVGMETEVVGMGVVRFCRGNG